MIGVWSGWSDKGVLSGTGSRIVRGGSSCPARMGCVKDRRPGIRGVPGRRSVRQFLGGSRWRTRRTDISPVSLSVR
jgi:hypothetical protein